MLDDAVLIEFGDWLSLDVFVHVVVVGLLAEGLHPGCMLILYKEIAFRKYN